MFFRLLNVQLSSLCACKQLGAPHWKTLKKFTFLKRRNFFDFLKNRIFRKLTTDFQNRTQRPADTKACVILDVDHKAIPYRISSVQYATRILHPFCTIPVWVQNIEISITRYSWEKKKLPENVSKLTNLWFSSLQSDQKWSLQRGRKVSALKAPLPAMGKIHCISSCTCVDKTTSPKTSNVFIAF